MTKAKSVEPVEAEETITVSASVLQELLAAVADLKTKVERSADERRELENQLAVAKSQPVAQDPAYVPNTLPPGTLTGSAEELRRPSLEEKLDSFEEQYKAKGRPFDRDYYRRLLSGEKVEPLIKYICNVCGTAPEPQTEDALKDHHTKHELESGRVIGKRRG